MFNDLNIFAEIFGTFQHAVTDNDIVQGIRMLADCFDSGPVVGVLFRRDLNGGGQILSLWRGPEHAMAGWNCGLECNSGEWLETVMGHYFGSERPSDYCWHHTGCQIFFHGAPTASPKHVAGLIVGGSGSQKVLLELVASAFGKAVFRIKGSCEQKCSPFLTSRENEILKWTSQGKSAAEIGLILGITERTTRFHLNNIYRKLRVTNRAQAVAEAVRGGIL